MDSQVSSQVLATRKKPANISCISLASNRLMNVTQLSLTWVGWPNSEKFVSTWVQILTRPK